jgi:hypothetical protein
MHQNLMQQTIFYKAKCLPEAATSEQEKQDNKASKRAHSC